jgi:hypothetical protein
MKDEVTTIQYELCLIYITRIWCGRFFGNVLNREVRKEKSKDINKTHVSTETTMM